MTSNHYSGTRLLIDSVNRTVMYSADSRRLDAPDGDGLDSGAVAWTLASTAFVLLMTPALAFFYGGLMSPRAVVHTMMLSFSSLAVIGITWSLFGYSLAFGPPISPSFDGLGGLAFGFFDSSNRVRAGTSIPEHAYFEFQGAFATITAAVVSGGVAGRIRLWAWCLFAAIWNLIVYVPLARWVFYEDGWLARLGVLDFAGGLVVEMASGVSAFVLAFWLGPGQTLHGGSHGAHQPHSLPLVLIGAGLLFFGWFGFNAGSALSAGYRASRAFANTHLAACSALASWGLSEWTWGGEKTYFSGHPSALGAATGVVVGLVAITPACGYISQMFSLLIGALAAPISYWAARLLKRSGIDDRLECLPCHGLAGLFGIIFTGLVAQRSEDSPVDGAFFGNPALLGIQLVGACVTLLMCVVGTTISYWIVWGIAKLCRLELRVEGHEEGRIDESQHHEQAYNHDTNKNGSLNAGLRDGDADSIAGTEDLSRALLLAADVFAGSESVNRNADRRTASMGGGALGHLGLQQV